MGWVRLGHLVYLHLFNYLDKMGKNLVARLIQNSEFWDDRRSGMARRPVGYMEDSDWHRHPCRVLESFAMSHIDRVRDHI